MRRANLFWPIVLIVLGGLWLLGNMGMLQGVNFWVIIWPLLLIVAGLSILFGVFGGRARSPESETLSIPLEGAEKARIRANYGAGRVTIRAGAGAGELLSGTFEDGVEHSLRRDGAALDVRLSCLTPSWSPFTWSVRPREWTVALNGGIPLELALEVGAADMRLDLADLRVTDLKLETGASSTEVTLPAKAGYTRVRVEGGAASVTIRVPEGVAGRVRSHSGVSDIKVNTSRFPRTGSLYESLDFAAAANKVDIEIQMGAGSVAVR